MISTSACRHWQPDRAANPAQQRRSYTTARDTIQQAGAKLFLLPKYSPDLNPIEQVFAKLKHMLRKAVARTKDAVCNAISTLLDTYTPQECNNYLKNAGYDRT